MTPKRPVVRPVDFKKFHSIAKICFADLPEFDTTDKHKLKDLFARALGYTNGLHEAQQCAESARPLAAGSITRFDIQYAVATGLSKLTGLPLDKAMRRAIRAPLELLSIDKATVEFADELAARSSTGKLSGADRHRLALKHASTDNRGELLEAGSPGYLFAVRPDGLCVDWMELSGVIKALEASEMPYQIGRVEAESWVSLSERMRQGMRMPLHDLVALFDGDGEYIGYVFRHAVHGGILPDLMVTAEDIHQGKIALLLGKQIRLSEGHSVWGGMGRDGSLPIFVLKDGITPPKPPSESWDRPQVDTSYLAPLHGVTGDYERYVRLSGEQGQNIWSLTGKRKVRPSIEDFNGYRPNCTYLETEDWLGQSDVPRLFTGSTGRELPDRDRSDPFGHKQLTFVPEFAREFQHAAAGLLADELEECDVMLSTYARDVQTKFDSVDPDNYQLVENLAKCALGELAPIASLTDAAYLAICDEHPLFSRFGPYTFRLAQQRCGADSSPGQIPTTSILAALILLSGCAATGDPVPETTAQIQSLVLGRWIEGRCTLEDIPALAAEFQSYKDKLDRQASRIADLDMILEHRTRTDRRARALRYAFLYGHVMSTRATLGVDEPVPTAKSVQG
ncbi:hypothetical protein LJY18_02200 [Pseudomonas sp. MMS21-TM103]|uniref:hypothetical protein n=1 Tax=Pseudomonas sp. MMS21 TM103 TaxID=2886506 RepID=UPI001EE00DD1|nr:hypothetical protein [Pseudomonas sp. MMS21 TM103]MCG4452114.1 hypothetical protein [Pseudomonas sp. MMS21 TM103]